MPFEETSDFNTFHYDTKEIVYHEVEASAKKNAGKIRFNTDEKYLHPCKYEVGTNR
jgi:hypothetical protein